MSIPQLCNTTSETVAKSQALSDLQANQSSINTNMSNDFTKYLTELGFDPNSMTAKEQNILAQQFVNDGVSAEFGVSGNQLQPPTQHFKGMGGYPKLMPRDWSDQKVHLEILQPLPDSKSRMQ